MEVPMGSRTKEHKGRVWLNSTPRGAEVKLIRRDERWRKPEQRAHRADKYRLQYLAAVMHARVMEKEMEKAFADGYAAATARAQTVFDYAIEHGKVDLAKTLLYDFAPPEMAAAEIIGLLDAIPSSAGLSTRPN